MKRKIVCLPGTTGKRLESYRASEKKTWKKIINSAFECGISCVARKFVDLSMAFGNLNPCQFGVKIPSIEFATKFSRHKTGTLRLRCLCRHNRFCFTQSTGIETLIFECVKQQKRSILNDAAFSIRLFRSVYARKKVGRRINLVNYYPTRIRLKGINSYFKVKFTRLFSSY